MLVLPEDIKHEVKTFRNNIATHYQTHHDLDIDTNGTHNVGGISTTYAELVKQFGEPITEGCDDGKVRAEWHLLLEGKYPATIYDWKRSEPIEEVTRWNLGGRNYTGCNVQIAIGNMLK